MTKTVQGIVHGKTIELAEEPGFADGQTVVVQVTATTSVTSVSPAQWGDGIRRSAGAMAPYWTEQDDQILNEIQQNRKNSPQREIPE